MEAHDLFYMRSTWSPGEYLRTTRLHRALALLRAQVGTVVEVSRIKWGLAARPRSPRRFRGSSAPRPALPGARQQT